MSVRYIEKNKRFVLETDNTLYAFELVGEKYLVNLHYGRKKTRIKSYTPVWLGFGAYERELGNKCCPDELSSEISFYGSGSYRRTALRINCKDGTGVTDFSYVGYRILKGREEIDGLPFARSDEDSETLLIMMRDPISRCELSLYYTVFPSKDVISRYMRVKNCGEGAVKLESIMPIELVFNRDDLDMITLWGKHANEFNYQRVRTHHGIQAISSRRGASSHQYNPFFALCSHSANENRGEVWGFNFVYSGSFLGEVELDQCNKTVVHLGLGTDDFGYILEPDESFSSPEAVMTYSCEGISRMSRNFHSFIRENILPKKSIECPHPVVLNTWEACYFNIDEQKLRKFKDKAAELGFDTLVIDDGWFGARDHDRAGLGDWYENKRKFPRGIKAFADEVRKSGLGFGIWIEPEMVNPDSDLYRKHPDWVIRAGEREPLLSRNQLVLDMSRDDVFEYLTESLERSLGDAEPDYFKWDMNRHISGMGSSSLPPERQDELSFRYMKGVYRLLSWLRKRFPNAFLETCSGGGGRYDLGMMCYGMQIWTSDRTNPFDRTRIQRGALTAYPAVTMSCHVSYPYGSVDKLSHRYKVALGGMLGYELNILETSDEINSMIKRQIEEYRTFEHVIRLGDYYRLDLKKGAMTDAFLYATKDGGELVLTVVSDEKCKASFTPSLVFSDFLNNSYKNVTTGDVYSSKEIKDGLRLPVSSSEGKISVYHLVKMRDEYIDPSKS